MRKPFDTYMKIANVFKFDAQYKNIVGYNDICEALKPVMGEISYTGLTGQDISWTAEGEPSKAPIVVKIVNGAYELQ